MPEMSPLEELAQLKASVALFRGAQAQAQAVEPELREKRDALIAAVCDLGAEHARRLFSGAWKERHGLLANCGVRDLPRTPEEEQLAERLRRVLTESAAGHPGALLAAMLLLPAFEVPLPPDLDRLPEWLLPEYGRFLLAAPRIFHRPGDSERYGVFVGGAVALFHRYIMRQPDSPLAVEMRGAFIEAASFMQLYFNELNLRDIYRQRAELLEGWLFAQGAPLAHLFPFSGAPRGARPLRIGVLCDHYYAHTETYFMLAHLERLPRERCTLTLYALEESGDSLEGYARSFADAAVTLPKHDAAAIARLRADDLDVLIIGSNVTIAAARWTLLACFRLARLQVISGSSPVTSGLTSADWYLSAEDNETEEGARTQFTEQVYRMPGMITRYAYYLDKDPATLAPSRAELGIPEGDTVFFSAANFFKIIPDLSAQWARVMAKLPGAWLILMPFNQYWSTNYLSEPFCARILEQVDTAGGDASRVLILDPVPTRADLHRVMSLADIYLDSFPFAGACSLLDPLMVELPVVAQAGHTFRGCVGAGMLQGLGLGDMAMADADAYVSRAVALAREPALRKQAKERIHAALSPRNPVFDSETGSRNLEAAIVDMVSQAERHDAALLRQPADALRAAIERVAADLARRGNSWFRGLTDLELIRLLLIPYFGSLPASSDRLQMLDVGACVGQTAEPFLAMGWKAELLEPDPACQEALASLSERHSGRARIHRVAVSERGEAALAFYKSAVGLSGLSPSPFGATEATLSVPTIRLDRFCREQRLARVDLLKIDAEGWDFEALRSHDFQTLPPRLAMVEFGTEFPRQSGESLAGTLAQMRALGYEPLFFSYEDHGNFKRQIWKYDLIAAGFDAPVARKDGHVGGNIVFFRQGDTLFLATLLRLFLSFLPPVERQAYVPSPSMPTR